MLCIVIEVVFRTSEYAETVNDALDIFFAANPLIECFSSVCDTTRKVFWACVYRLNTSRNGTNRPMHLVPFQTDVQLINNFLQRYSYMIMRKRVRITDNEAIEDDDGFLSL